MAQTIMNDIRRLAAETGFPRVTIHAPMQRRGREVRQNRVTLENAAKTAVQNLIQRGMDSREAEEFMRPVRDLASDEERMQHQTGSISVFVDSDGYEEIELPAEVRPMTFAGDRYSILELLPPAIENREFAILAISLGGVGLYECSRFSCELVELDGLPEDLCYVLRYDDFEKSVQHHATSGGGSATMHHGHGAGTADHDTFVRRFIKEVEPRVTAHLSTRQSPLVLVGTEDAIGFYRANTDYPYVRDQHAIVDPHSLSLDDLLQLGWECMEPDVAAERSKVLERCESSADSLHGIYGVLPVLAEGRADTLLIDPDQEIWGTFDETNEDVHVPSAQEADRTASGENLVNVAASLALRHGTRVVPMHGEIEKPAVIIR